MTIAALAGRRIDAEGAAAPVFPLRHRDRVRQRIREVLIARDVQLLVCSAACGADLLALDAARQLSIRRRIILPFARERFRTTSVIDRPGDWGPLFDDLCTTARAHGDLRVLHARGTPDEAYARATSVILEDALGYANQSNRAGDRPDGASGPVIALVVWNGVSRGAGDLTAAFAEQARTLMLSVIEIATHQA